MTNPNTSTVIARTTKEDEAILGKVHNPQYYAPLPPYEGGPILLLLILCGYEELQYFSGARASLNRVKKLADILNWTPLLGGQGGKNWEKGQKYNSKAKSHEGQKQQLTINDAKQMTIKWREANDHQMTRSKWQFNAPPPLPPSLQFEVKESFGG